MAVTHGMNPDEVEALGHKLQSISGQIQGIINQLNGSVGGTSWVGPDANTFKNNWWPEHRAHLTSVVNELHGFGQSALNNASEQRSVSGR